MGYRTAVAVKGGKIFEVASTATVTVYDRQKKRLGTIYLAQAPEPKQVTLGCQLTKLITDVLSRWQGSSPRLCYVTDAGDNETTYYNTTLRRMRHPVTDKQLDWVRVVDYYHTSVRLWSMAEALFGKATKAGYAWARRMQKLLKKPRGIRRVLNSASVLRSRMELGETKKKEFYQAYNYLRLRTKYMQYAKYERVGIPMGSGITEAACKTIITQRMKLSGMRWKKAGAQTILNLRILLLSDVWDEAYQRVLRDYKTVKVPTYARIEQELLKIAA